MNGFYSAILMRAHIRTLVSQLSCDIHPFIHDDDGARSNI